MLAILGLLGLAFAGTAFVSVGEDSEDEDTPSAAPPDDIVEKSSLLYLFEEDLAQSGTNGLDKILGDSDDDTILGLGGQDYIDGEEGDDRILEGEEKVFLHDSSGDGMVSGGADADQFETALPEDSEDVVTIMDYEVDEDVLVLRHIGSPPLLTVQPTDMGVTLLADGLPVADLVGLETFDVTTVQMRPA